jgi:hypothetical protein
MMANAVAVGVVLFASASTGTTELRLTMRSHGGANGCLVSADLGGKSVRFLVDSGSGITCLDRRLADELQLPTAGEAQARGVGGQLIPARLVWLEGLRFGPLPPVRQMAGVLDLSWANDLRDQEAGTDVAGILGADFLFRTGGVVDFDRLTLRLHDPVRWDLRRMQGRWRSVSVVRNGAAVGIPASLSVTGDRVKVTYDQPEGVRAYTGRLILGQNGRPDRLVVTDLELLDPPLKPRPYKFAGFTFTGRDDPIMPFDGLYAFDQSGRLAVLLPADLRRDRPGLPNILRSPVGGGLDLITFEQDRGTPGATAPDVPTLVFRLTGWVVGHLQPGGWRLAVAPDWALTGVNPDRRLRFTARLDGTLLLAPER